MLRLFPKKKLRIIIDTNACLLPGQGIDIFTEIDRLMDSPYDLFVIEDTFDELKKISEGKAGKNLKGKDKQNAKLAFILLSHKNVRQLRNKAGSVDDSIVGYMNDSTFIVTLDKALQKRMQKENGKILTVKSGRLDFL